MQENIMERAYALAMSGECETADDVAERLKAEGFEGVHAHLSGPFTRKQIRSLCARSKRKKPE